MQNPQLVFVYGTLKKGQGNHGLLRDANFIGRGHTMKPNYQMYSLGPFPGVVLGDREIYGEVYMVDSKAMSRLDHLEGHPFMYERHLIDVGIYGDKKGEESKGKAWMYIYKGDVTDCEPLRNWT